MKRTAPWSYSHFNRRYLFNFNSPALSSFLSCFSVCHSTNSGINSW